MNDLSFQKSPDKSQISYFLLCNYIGLFIPVARLESDRLFKHAQSLQLAGDKSHTNLPGTSGGGNGASHIITGKTLPINKESLRTGLLDVQMLEHFSETNEEN